MRDDAEVREVNARRGPLRRQFLKSLGVIGAGSAVSLRSDARQPYAALTMPAGAPNNSLPETATTTDSAQRSETGGGEIPRRPFGRSGVMISALGLGGHHLGDIKSVDEAVSVVHEAMDAGITFFDNCWEYHNGKSEDWMGRALKGRREKVFLMTKVCTHGRDGKLALQMLEESLRRLQTDRLDLWQIHAVTYDNDPELAYAKGGVLEAFDQAKRQGKVRFVGFTGHKDPSFHLRMLELGYPFDSVQMPLNPFDANFFSFERQVLPEVIRRGMAPLGMKSMGGTAEAIKKGAITAEEALRYAMSLPVTTTIAGMDSLDVLRQNLRIARGFAPMKSDEMASLVARCAQWAADGRYEVYKTTIKYDNPETRRPHNFPIDPQQKEIKELLEQATGADKKKAR